MEPDSEHPVLALYTFRAIGYTKRHGQGKPEETAPVGEGAAFRFIRSAESFHPLWATGGHHSPAYPQFPGSFQCSLQQLRVG